MTTDFVSAIAGQLVTQPILTAAENTLVELLNSDQARQVILTTIAPSDTVRENLQAHVGSETFWATREILNAAGLNPVQTIAAPILNQTPSLTHDLLASSAGFIDQNIRIGDLWDEKLEQAISSAFAVIPIRTPSSVQSRWVRLEARYAFRMGILCPILRQPCLPPLELPDVEFANLTDWEPDNTQHAEWNNLVNSLRRLQLGNNQPRPGSAADLCFRLGMRFLEGLQAPQNDTMALQWFTKALHLGNPRASAAISALKLPGHNDIQIITAEIHPKDDSKPAAATPEFQTPKTMPNDESSRCDNWFRTSSTQPSSMS